MNENENKMDKVILCKCPICGKDARTLDSRKDIDDSLTRCDSNESYRCYTAKSNETLRYILRVRKQSDIDWNEVDRVNKGVSAMSNQNQ